QVAVFAQCVRPDTVIATVIVREIEQLAVQLAIHTVELMCTEHAGISGRYGQRQCHDGTNPCCASHRLFLSQSVHCHREGTKAAVGVVTSGTDRSPSVRRLTWRTPPSLVIWVVFEDRIAPLVLIRPLQRGA